MIQKEYSIFNTEHNQFELMCQSLLDQIGKKSRVIKIVFFGAPNSNEEYLDQLGILSEYTREYFASAPPVISYISQKPMFGELNAEVVSLESEENICISYGDNYLVLNNGICRELVTGGVLASDINASFLDQSKEVFARIEKILTHENFAIKSIVRQWNYIENITRFDGDHQHYQDFNDSRSHFYAKTKWDSGYPAATGIGTQYGGVMVELIAFTGEAFIDQALDNPLQVSPHKYSQQVLLGAKDEALDRRTTPKFERGRVLGLQDTQTIFISGTAAIRGEHSLVSDDVTEQTRMTMANIDHLISPQNCPLENASRVYEILRIYVKEYDHMEGVSKYMEANYPEVKKIYLHADICRDELLLEIEGYALLSNDKFKMQPTLCIS
jgi:enamine deaminase RidA (YjgF/YER057c/UK114 family)